MCSKHGHCVKVAAQLLEQLEQQQSSSATRSKQAWQCRCDNGWGGHDCSAPQETNCVDEIDNDNGKRVTLLLLRLLFFIVLLLLFNL